MYLVENKRPHSAIANFDCQSPKIAGFDFIYLSSAIFSSCSERETEREPDDLSVDSQMSEITK